MNDHFMRGFVDEIQKCAVWTAPGQKNLGESLPGKISPNRTFDQLMDRLFGSKSVKTRMGFARELKETKRTESPKAARDVLAIARAHAAGRPGVEGHLGQKAIEEAKTVKASQPRRYMTRSLLNRLTRGGMKRGATT